MRPSLEASHSGYSSNGLELRAAVVVPSCIPTVCGGIKIIHYTLPQAQGFDGPMNEMWRDLVSENK